MRDHPNHSRQTPSSMPESITQAVRSPTVFISAVVVLVLLNLLVWLWLKPVYGLADQTLSTPARQAFVAERNRLERIIEAPCNSAIIDAYVIQRNHSGRNPSVTPGTSVPSPQSEGLDSRSSTSELSYASLVSLLQNASVRVVTGNSYGSGFFINDQTIVTNRHVVDKGLNDPIFVTSKALGPLPLPVRVVALTPASEIGKPDFAILELPNPVSEVTPLRVGRDPSPLQEVISVGFPGLLTEIDIDSVTPSPIFGSGSVKTIKPQPDSVSLVFHTADISSGNSGGPLVNLCGQVVGVNTFVIAEKDHMDGRALSALASSTLIDFLLAHQIEYQPAQEVCGGQ